MKNITLKTTDKKLTITIDLNQSIGPSSSGKSILVATTSGNVEVPNAAGFKIGVNVYKKKDE